MNDPMRSVTDRLDRLERQNANLKRALISIGLIGATTLVLGGGKDKLGKTMFQTPQGQDPAK